MRFVSFIVAIVLTASGSDTVFAFCEDGQQPAPPAVAAQMALPACGFAAVKRWGPNGCQLCDPRNIYPNPFTGNGASYAGPRSRAKQPGGTW